jgi:DNA-binding MarR family transcriptional regulator
MVDTPSAGTQSQNEVGEPRSDYETGLSKDEQLDVRIWLRLLTCANLIEHRVRKNLRKEFSTTLPRFDVLAQVDRPPDSQPMRELSSRMMVTNGNITPLVDRLVKDKLIQRDPAPDDRRVQHVSLTSSGKEALDKMIPAHNSWVNNLMADLDRTNASDLYELLGELKKSILVAENKLQNNTANQQD